MWSHRGAQKNTPHKSTPDQRHRRNTKAEIFIYYLEIKHQLLLGTWQTLENKLSCDSSPLHSHAHGMGEQK